MKKTVIIALIVILLIGSVFIFTACDKDSDLQYGVRYTNKPTVNPDDIGPFSYYCFEKDGTGIYYQKFISNNDYQFHDYTVHFNYSFADNDKSIVVCYYDSIEGENYPDYSAWSIRLLVSKNTIVHIDDYGNTCHVNENYYDEYDKISN